MSSGVYNALTMLLLTGASLCLIGSIAYLIAALVGWRGPHRRARLWRFVIGAALAPCLLVAQQMLLHWAFLPSLGRQLRAEMQASTRRRADAAALVKQGDQVPAFRLMDADGNEFSTDDLRGKVLLINFFASWCGPCLMEMPQLQKLWESSRADSDFVLLVIGREETDEAMRKFRTEQGFTFPIAADPDRAVYSQFAKELIPRTYMISREGKICFTSAGYYEEEFEALQRELAAQLGKQRPLPQ